MPKKLRLWRDKDGEILADSCFEEGESRDGFREVFLDDLDDDQMIQIGAGGYVRADAIVDSPDDVEDDDDDDDDDPEDEETPQA